MQKLRNVAPVADINLLPGIIDSCSCITGVFKLKDTQRHAIDKEQDIRSACFALAVVDVFYAVLIYDTEDVFFRMLKINQLYYFWRAVMRRKQNAVNHPVIYVVQRCKFTAAANKAYFIINGADFVNSQLRIGVFEKGK